MSARPQKRLKKSWKNSLLWLTEPRLRNHNKHQVIRYEIIDQPSSNLSSLSFLYHSFSRSLLLLQGTVRERKVSSSFWSQNTILACCMLYIFLFSCSRLKKPYDCHFDVLFVYSLHPNTSMHILHTVLYTSLDKWLTRNNCWRAYVVGGHFLYSRVFIVWLRGVIVERNKMWITLRG